MYLSGTGAESTSPVEVSIDCHQIAFLQSTWSWHAHPVNFKGTRSNPQPREKIRIGLNPAPSQWLVDIWPCDIILTNVTLQGTAKERRAMGSRFCKRFYLMVKRNSWKKQSLFLPKHTLLGVAIDAAATSSYEPAEDYVRQWGWQSRKERRTRVFKDVFDFLRTTHLALLATWETKFLIFKLGEPTFFCY